MIEGREHDAGDNFISIGREDDRDEGDASTATVAGGFFGQVQPAKP